MFKKFTQPLLYKMLDVMVKISLLLISTLLLLHYSAQQKHVTTELSFIEKNTGIGTKIDTQKIIVDSNNSVLNVVNERQFNTLLLLTFLIKSIIILAILMFIITLIARYPRRQGIFALIIMCVGMLISNIVTNNTVIPTVKELTVTALLMTGLACIYFMLRKKLNKTVANSHALLVFASQSGSAYNLAKIFEKKLPHLLDIKCISHLTPQCIAQYEQILFIASTFGPGQPPDKAHSFLKRLKKINTFNHPVNYSILALGDSSYQHYCAFGHQLDKLFTEKGATSITDIVEVDRMNGSAINNWWHNITSSLSWGESTIEEQTFNQLTVTEHLCINANNLNRQAFHLSMTRNNLEYQVGDLLEVLPKQNEAQCLSRLNSLAIDPTKIVSHTGQQKTILCALMESEWCQTELHHAQSLAHKLKPLASRVYSIASAPHQQDNIEIFVRRHVGHDGTPGVASNYLAECTPNTHVIARIKQHPNFHLVNNNAPLILIGAGTGIAPLMSFIRQASTNRVKRDVWLFFGEQYQTPDFYFKTEINTFVQNNVITKLTTAWSRENKSQYVQDAMYEQQEQLKIWLIERNAQVYLCGKQEGFGKSVIATLTDMLTQDQLVSLKQENRLHVDLY